MYTLKLLLVTLKKEKQQTKNSWLSQICKVVSYISPCTLQSEFFALSKTFGSKVLLRERVYFILYLYVISAIAHTIQKRSSLSKQLPLDTQVKQSTVAPTSRPLTSTGELPGLCLRRIEISYCAFFYARNVLERNFLFSFQFADHIYSIIYL